MSRSFSVATPQPRGGGHESVRIFHTPDEFRRRDLLHYNVFGKQLPISEAHQFAYSMIEGVLVIQRSAEATLSTLPTTFEGSEEDSDAADPVVSVAGPTLAEAMATSCYPVLMFEEFVQDYNYVRNLRISYTFPAFAHTYSPRLAADA